MTPSIPTTIDLIAAMYDLRRVCVHEAGHLVIAGQWVSKGWASIWLDTTDSLEATRKKKFVCGKFTFYKDDFTAHQLRLIAIAGAVAEALDVKRDPDLDEWFINPDWVWERMSKTDRALSGCSEDDGAFDLLGIYQATMEVRTLLLGPLAGKYRKLVTSLAKTALRPCQPIGRWLNEINEGHPSQETSDHER